MTKPVAVAWQMRWARQLPDGSYAEWHTISKEKYDWGVKNSDPCDEYRALCVLDTKPRVSRKTKEPA